MKEDSTNDVDNVGRVNPSREIGTVGYKNELKTTTERDGRKRRLTFPAVSYNGIPAGIELYDDTDNKAYDQKQGKFNH